MRTKLIYSSEENHPGYGAGEGTLKDTNMSALAGKEKS